MKILCDVHIAWRVVNFLRSRGFDATHVNELPERWHTPDSFITQLADQQGAVVLTKDADFRNSFLLRGTPKKLLHVCLGNTSNQELIERLTNNLLVLEHFSSRSTFCLELNSVGLEVIAAE